MGSKRAIYKTVLQSVDYRSDPWHPMAQYLDPSWNFILTDMTRYTFEGFQV